MFCVTCGKQISDLAVLCPGCGHPTGKRSENSGEKKKLVALLLCLHLGFLGAHRFYVGKTKTAVLQLILAIAFIVTSFYVTSFSDTEIEEIEEIDNFIFLAIQCIAMLLFLIIWILIDLVAIVRGKFADDQGKIPS